MKITTRALAAVGVAAMVAVVTAPAAEATTYGWRWADDSVQIVNDTKSKDIDAALKTLEGLPIGLDIEVVRKCTSDCITVTYGDTDRNDDGVLEAWGYAYFDVRNGVVSSCRADVSDTLKGGNPRSSPRSYAPNVALHEVGHCLGLDHTNETMSSIMVPYATMRQAPSAYDIADLQSLYGVR